MNKMKLCCLVLTICLLSGCVGLPLGPASSPTDSQPPAAQVTPIPAIQLEPCALDGTTGLCGTLRVYENRAAQTGRMIDLSVAVIKARDPQPAPDPIFWLAGGPGASAIEDAYGVLRVLGQANAQRDLVFVDQRGVGGSHNLVCDQPQDLSLQVQALQNCLKDLDADPSAYTTAWAMDDVDDVRQALGYDQINVYGQSYGATAVQVYLLRHADHVRTASIVNGSLLDVPMFERWHMSSQAALDSLFARCQADAACHSSYPALEQEFAGALDRLEQGPLTLPVNDPATGQPARLTLALFKQGVHILLSRTEEAIILPHLIHLVYREDLNGLAAIIGPMLNAGAQTAQWQIMNLEILCFEEWAKNSPAEKDAFASGSYLGYEDVQALTVRKDICDVMPAPQPEALYGPVTPASVPVLLINGEMDPQDPPANVEAAKQVYPNSLALIAPGQAHGYTGTPCRALIIADFIGRGSGEGVDTACLNEVPLPAFFIP